MSALCACSSRTESSALRVCSSKIPPQLADAFDLGSAPGHQLVKHGTPHEPARSGRQRHGSRDGVSGTGELLLRPSLNLDLDLDLDLELDEDRDQDQVQVQDEVQVQIQVVRA
jgi:hypothetical protein